MLVLLFKIFPKNYIEKSLFCCFMADFGDFQPKQVSVYNDAQLATMRWHEYVQKCSSSRNNGELDVWRFKMDEMWDNLWAKAKKQSLVEVIGDVEVADKEIALAAGEYKKEPVNKRGSYYLALRKKYQLLDYAREKLGMGTRFRDSEENEMDA